MATIKYSCIHNFKQIYQAVIQINKHEGNMCEWNYVSEKIHTSFSKSKDIAMT